MKQLNSNYQFSNYLISEDLNNFPSVYSTRTKSYLTISQTKNGYRMVTVKNDSGKSITMNYARFLLILTNPQEDYSKLVADHINRDKTDDRISNLRWISQQLNCLNRKYAKRPNRNRTIILEFDNGEKHEYTHKMKDKFPNIPYVTIYTLATAKEGRNYSPKYSLTAYYKN